MPEIDKTEISRRLGAWYDCHRRDLPWRNTRDPYHIWLSEIILQQTRIAQGLPYYLDFVESFPDVEHLAAADEATVLKHWQGLGYYSRARNLHQAAQTIVGQYGGKFPDTYAEVLSLKGIGEYTAAAILSFAFDQPYAVLDGNVYRVLARLFDLHDNILDNASAAKFRRLAQELLDPIRPGRHNQAIMEFGETWCLPGKPDCAACPLRDLCLACARQTADKLPVREAPHTRRIRYFNYLCFHQDRRLCLVQRSKKDIWQHLWEFPLLETDTPASWNELCRRHPWLGPVCPQGEPESIGLKHQLSHQTIQATFYDLPLPEEEFLQEHFPDSVAADFDSIAFGSQGHVADGAGNSKEKAFFPVSRLTERAAEKLFNIR